MPVTDALETTNGRMRNGSRHHWKRRRRLRTLAVGTGIAGRRCPRVAETFTAPGDEVERLMYGFSILHWLPASRTETPSVVRRLPGEGRPTSSTRAARAATQPRSCGMGSAGGPSHDGRSAPLVERLI